MSWLLAGGDGGDAVMDAILGQPYAARQTIVFPKVERAMCANTKLQLLPDYFCKKL